MDYILEFERPVRELEGQIQELQESSSHPGVNIDKEILGLKQKASKLIEKIYQDLGPWDRVLLSRHPNRPHSLFYIEGLIKDFKEIHGDRHFGDDESMVAGMGFFADQPVAVLGIEKGTKTADKIRRNFGMPHPEGYRKASRLMALADKFQLPLICFIDTPGAYPGMAAEERGQSGAIAQALVDMLSLNVPTCATVIGEGGSGGALGIALADNVYMQEYSVYSVISPESCASILWSDPKKAHQAADALKLGPHTALELGLIDGILSEPAGGAHRNHEQALELIKNQLEENLGILWSQFKKSPKDMKQKRLEKFRKLGNQTLQEPSLENS